MKKRNQRSISVLARHAAWGLCALLLLFTGAAISEEPSNSDGFEMRGGVVGQVVTKSAGGAFGISVTRIIPGGEDGEFTFRDRKNSEGTSATGCPCQTGVIFTDSFENGTLDAWDSSVEN